MKMWLRIEKGNRTFQHDVWRHWCMTIYVFLIKNIFLFFLKLWNDLDGKSSNDFFCDKNDFFFSVHNLFLVGDVIFSFFCSTFSFFCRKWHFCLFHLLLQEVLTQICERDREWRRQNCRPGVNFTNILHAAFTQADPKSAKRQSS